MKKLLLIVLSVFSVSFLWWCDIAMYDIVDYNDSLVDQYDIVTQKFNDFHSLLEVTSIDKDSLVILEEKRIATIEYINSLKPKIKEIGSYRWNSTFLDALLNDIDVMIDILDTEYKQLILLWGMRDKYSSNGVVPQTEKDKEKEIIDSYIKRIDESEEILNKAQTSFASKYDYEVEKD